MVGFVRWTAAFISVVQGLGCVTYEPLPLDPEAERLALSRQTLEGFVVQHEKPGVGLSQGSEPFDLSDGLNEKELVAVALTLNPDLRAKRLQVGEAQALLITAGLWPNPVFGADWRPGISGAPGYTLDADLLVDLLRFWERSARKGAASARIQEVAAEVVAEEWRVVSEVRIQRLAVLSLERSKALLDEEVALREKILDLVQRRRQAGDGTELDVSAADLELAELKRERRRTEADLESARRELSRLLGLPPEYAVRLTESGRPIPIPVFDDLEDPELERRFMSGRFELRAKEASYQRAERELELAIYGQYPRVGVGPSFNREPEGTKYLGLGLSLEIPLFNRNQGEIAEKENQRTRVRAEYDALLHRIKAAAYEARARCRRARSEIEIEEKEILPLVRRSELLYESAFRSKELGVLDWVTAQRRALQSRRAYIDALVGYRASVIQLESATGIPLSAPVGPSPLKKKE